MRTSSNRNRRQRVRTQVAAAFRRVMHGVSKATAFERTKDFFRAAGGTWTVALA